MISALAYASETQSSNSLTDLSELSNSIGFVSVPDIRLSMCLVSRLFLGRVEPSKIVSKGGVSESIPVELVANRVEVGCLDLLCQARALP